MRLNHNLASLNIYRNQVGHLASQSNALNNISSGQRINSAKDDPNAIAKSERMRMQIRGLQMASTNIQDGTSMMQSVDGDLDSVTSMLQRIRELTLQASGTTNSDDKKVIKSEIDQMIKGIDQTVHNSEFNGVNLINDTTSDNNNPNLKYMSVGANVDEKVAIPKYNLSSDAIGSKISGQKLSQIDITSEQGIGSALETIDGAMETVLSARSKYGAIENRFESLYDNLDNIGTIIQGAESGIRDADIASEMLNYSKDGILVEAGNAMLAQTNNFPKEILKVLENIK